MNRSILFFLVVLVAGCSVLPEKSPVALYSLIVPAASDKTVERVDWRLAVARPQASGPLASAWILVQPRAGQIEIYPGAQWSEALPGLIGTALMEALEADGRIANVQRASAGLAHDFELAVELRDFQLEPAHGPSALVRLKANLIDAARGNVVASRGFEVRQPAAGQGVDDAVAALDAGLQQILPELADWVLAQGEATRER